MSSPTEVELQRIALEKALHDLNSRSYLHGHPLSIESYVVQASALQYHYALQSDQKKSEQNTNKNQSVQDEKNKNEENKDDSKFSNRCKCIIL